MTLTYFYDLEQGTDEWLRARLGIVTASEMKRIITPKLKVASNDKSRAHAYEIAAQRIGGYIEATFMSDDMERGNEFEGTACDLYSASYNHVETCGFVTEDKWGFTIGYSPDGLVGDDGLIEIKSPRQKKHVEIIVSGVVPEEYMLQCQTALLVTGRNWVDFISFCSGFHMMPIRVFPDLATHNAILQATEYFEKDVNRIVKEYEQMVKAKDAITTDRIETGEIV